MVPRMVIRRLGTVLYGVYAGPLLFCVYINDLGDGISPKLSRFADETKKQEQQDCQTTCQSAEASVSGWFLQCHAGDLQPASVPLSKPCTEESSNPVVMDSLQETRKMFSTRALNRNNLDENTIHSNSVELYLNRTIEIWILNQKRSGLSHTKKPKKTQTLVSLRTIN